MNYLQGKKIVVTRSPKQAEEFISLLKAAGAEPILFPTIEIAPPSSWDECDKAIKNIGRYDGLIFSSTNAVEYFFQRVNGKNIRKIPVYVVGDKTGKEVRKHGLVPVSPPKIHDGKHLAEKILRDGAKGKRFLHPTGNLSRATLRNELKNNGAEIDEVIVYNTIAPPGADTNNLKKMLQQKEIDAVTFFSPSSVENFTAIIPSEMLSETAIAAIGKTTADAAVHNGLTVDIIAEPSISEGMVNALQQFFYTSIW